MLTWLYLPFFLPPCVIDHIENPKTEGLQAGGSTGFRGLGFRI